MMHTWTVNIRDLVLSPPGSGSSRAAWILHVFTMKDIHRQTIERRDPLTGLSSCRWSAHFDFIRTRFTHCWHCLKLSIRAFGRCTDSFFSITKCNYSYLLLLLKRNNHVALIGYCVNAYVRWLLNNCFSAYSFLQFLAHIHTPCFVWSRIFIQPPGIITQHVIH